MYYVMNNLNLFNVIAEFCKIFKIVIQIDSDKPAL